MARKGVDQIKVTALRNAASAAKKALDEHVKICYTCHSSARDAYQYCPDGWKLAKENSRAVNVLTIYLGTFQDKPTGEQLELF